MSANEKRSANDDLLGTVERFAFPRFAGGAGERRAGDLVEEAFRAAGLQVGREPFTTATGAMFRLRLLIQGIVALAVVALAWTARLDPAAAALFGAALLLLISGAGTWRRGLEGAFDVGRQLTSENIVGRRAQPGAHPVRVVILAHRDTKSSALPTLVPAVVVLMTVAWVLAVTVAAGVTLLRGGAAVPGAAVILPTAFGVAGLLVAVAFNPSGDRSVGAMDNATGLAVLLHAARELPKRTELREVDLTFLCTGAEELGLAGALRWIQAHAAELDPARTVFVNVDSVGVGRLLLAVDVRGRAPGGRALATVVREAARRAQVPLRMLPFLPGAGVDSMPIGARGFATVTILGQVFGGAAGRIHTARDTIEHLNEEGLQHAARLVEEIVRQAAAS